MDSRPLLGSALARSSSVPHSCGPSSVPTQTLQAGPGEESRGAVSPGMKWVDTVQAEKW